MSRYLLFCFDTYYPRGGWSDFIGSGDSIEQAMLKASDSSLGDNWQVVDTQTWQLVADNIIGIYNPIR